MNLLVSLVGNAKIDRRTPLVGGLAGEVPGKGTRVIPEVRELQELRNIQDEKTDDGYSMNGGALRQEQSLKNE